MIDNADVLSMNFIWYAYVGDSRESDWNVLVSLSSTAVRHADYLLRSVQYPHILLQIRAIRFLKPGIGFIQYVSIQISLSLEQIMDHNVTTQAHVSLLHYSRR